MNHYMQEILKQEEEKRRKPNQPRPHQTAYQPQHPQQPQQPRQRENVTWGGKDPLHMNQPFYPPPPPNMGNPQRNNFRRQKPNNNMQPRGRGKFNPTQPYFPLQNQERERDRGRPHQRQMQPNRDMSTRGQRFNPYEKRTTSQPSRPNRRPSPSQGRAHSPPPHNQPPQRYPPRKKHLKPWEKKQQQKEQEPEQYMSEQASEPQYEEQQQDEEEMGMEEGADYEDEQNGEDQQDEEEQEQSDNDAVQEEVKPQVEQVRAVNNEIKEIRVIDDMCAKQQFEDRLQTFKQNNKGNEEKLRLDTSRSFSIFQINKQTKQPDLRLTLKRFRRSADREGENDQEGLNIRRSPLALWRVISHINQEIIDSDRKRSIDVKFYTPSGQKNIQFIQIYDFLWDRMREMIKDITRLNEQQKKGERMIKVCEQMARFFIIAMHEGKQPHQSKLQFDPKMNLQALIKVLTPLMEIYTTSRTQLKQLVNQMKQKNQELDSSSVRRAMKERRIYVSPNQPEMTCYAILISTDFRKYIHQNIMLGFQSTSFNPLFSSKEISLALQIQNSLYMNNSEKFFQILQSSDADYVLSCLMLHRLKWVRENTCNRAFSNYRYQKQMKIEKGIHQKELKKILKYKESEDEEFYNFLTGMGAHFFDNSPYILPPSQRKALQNTLHASAFSFTINKQSRDFYTDIVPDFKKKVLNMDSIITRQELVTRSWHNGGYVQNLIQSYLGKEMEMHSLKPRIEISKPINPAPVPEERSMKLEQLRKKAMDNKIIKEKEKKRKIFIEKLSEMVMELVESDTQYRKGIQNLSLFIHNKLCSFKMCGLMAIEAEGFLNQEKRYIFCKIRQYTKKRKQYKAKINKNPYQFQQKEKKTESKTMQELLLGKKRVTSIVDSSLYDYLLADLKKKQQQEIFNITIFHSSSLSTNSLYQRVVKKIIQYIFGKAEIEIYRKSDQNYTLKEKNICISVNLVQLTEQGYWRTFGSNLILFVGMEAAFESQAEQILRFLWKMKKQMKEEFLIPSGLLRFIVPEIQYHRKQKSSKGQTFDIQQTSFLRASAVMLNVSTKRALKKLFEVSLSALIETPFIRTVPILEIMKQICSTLVHLKPRIQKLCHDSEHFIYHQEYLNLCFEQVFGLQENYFHHFELFPNWIELVNCISEGQKTDRLNIKGFKQRMRAEYSYNKQLMKQLKLAIPQQLYKQDNSFNHQDLQRICMKIINKFDMQSLCNQLTLRYSLKELKVRNGRLYGDPSPFFNYFLSIIGRNLQDQYLILPKKFRLSINLQNFIERVFESQNYKNLRITAPINFPNQINPMKFQTSNHECFQYERNQWLRTLKKKMKCF